MFKITAYGVRPIEVPYFHKLNHNHYDLNLVPDLLDQQNANVAKGSDGVLLRGNCQADRHNLEQFKEWGINYVFTRTVGVDHIDLPAAQELGITVARVPSYSPYAVAELALTLGMTLFRKVGAELTNTHAGRFTVADSYFSKEIHSSTVGIIGCGRIGAAEARLYAGMGTTVLGYDPNSSDPHQKNGIPLVDLPELLQRADLVSLHVPLIAGQTENLIGATELQMMKPAAILINTARSQVVNLAAVTTALQHHQLGGYGADVVVDERHIFGNDFATLADLPSPELRHLMEHFPNVIITPHVGSFTEPALQDMITTSYQNFATTIATGTCPNVVQ
ncbi:lactate dehydrogenase [Fructilactobacillus myrtifloralis]|uniref:Lactate dehydrogenase n=1 Tax=Fructilactobacillus myrtifloralis TaxID=2940301 RepID=A0ABY5BR93_9LACO|nr:NAD(P)-dependent oxidoreductase [Fructilactobacillus myrtifloralis]USS85567.1 lactate dehydrogenase [Fructilactobacillus myrtifloralis]